MVDPLTNYRIATDTLLEAKTEWHRFAKRLKLSAEWLASTASPETFATLKTDNSGPLRADQWPTANTIIELSRRVDEARTAAFTAYEMISEADRKIVHPPGSI